MVLEDELSTISSDSTETPLFFPCANFQTKAFSPGIVFQVNPRIPPLIIPSVPCTIPQVCGGIQPWIIPTTGFPLFGEFLPRNYSLFQCHHKPATFSLFLPSPLFFGIERAQHPIPTQLRVPQGSRSPPDSHFSISISQSFMEPPHK